MTATTRDALGELTLEQPARGYRVNVDALLLADFVGDCRGVVFDLGAGVGAIGLTLVKTDRARDVVLVERDAATAKLARANVEHNGLANRATVIEADVTEVAREYAGKAGVVVCNPPYVRPGGGREPHESKRAARIGDVVVFVRAARAMLASRARACFAYPANDFIRIAADFRAHGLEPKRVRFVHSTRDSPARIVLIEVLAGKPGGLKIEPALVERV